MCVLAIAWRAHPRWKLVVAGNRDEMHGRPTKGLHRWDDGLIAGRDLESGGTWMGVAEPDRFAVVTNYRGAPAPTADAPSRGLLLTDFLTGADAYAPNNLSAFAGVSLITVGGDSAEFRTNGPSPSRHALTPGLYGLSNAGLDEPWPKTVRLKAILAQWLEADAEPTALFDGLAEDGGEGSPIFIRNPVYGTRCSTVVTVDADGAGRIIERRFDAQGQATGETALDFSWRS